MGAGTEIFRLFGSILIDNTEANNSLSKTDSTAKGVFDTLSGGIKTAAAVAVGIGTAAVSAGAAIYGIATKSAAAADEVDKMSAKIGISRQGYQEWSYVLGQNGMDVDKLQVGLKTLTSQMDAAAGGSKTAQGAFNSLGLTWDDGNGKLKSQETMMNEAIYALANMENGTEKARLATELFGKAGSEMMPMLNNGAEGIDELKGRAEELGLIMGDDAVDAGVKLGDTIDDVKQTFGAIATKIGVEAMPIIQQAAEWVLSVMPEVQSALGVVFDFLGSFVSAVVNYITMLKDAALSWYENNTETVNGIVATLQGFAEQAQGVFNSVIEFLTAFVAWCTEMWAQYGDQIIAIITPIWESVKTIFSAALTIIQAIFDTFAAVFRGDWSAAWQGIVTIFTTIIETIKKLASNMVTAIVAALKLKLQAMRDAGKAIFTAVFDGMKSVWDGIVSWVSDKVNWLKDKLAFWNSGKSTMNDVDGSHATGLAYVPFDGYRAILHQGERVLTAAENQEYNDGTDRPGDGVTQVNNFYNCAEMSEAEATAQERELLRKLKEGF